MELMDRHPAHWLPARLFWGEEAEAQVTWLHGEDEQFSESFLQDTFNVWMRRPINAAFAPVTSLERLRARAASLPGIAPTGFIFHVSRCGSTLLSRLLAQAPDTLVLSEPPPFDAIVRANHRARRMTEALQIDTLRAMASALGQPRTPGQNRLFIKLDAWHALQAPLLRAAFPDTPWVFLYRNPIEVMVSQLRQRGMHTVPGVLPPALIGGADPSAVSPEDYCAKVLGAIFAAGLAMHTPGRSLLINYSDLPNAINPIARHFGLDPNDPDFQTALARELKTDAKRGGDFTPDSVTKRAEATPAIHAATMAWLTAIYDQLEDARRA
ncbi:sulfotransferase [Brevundimonas sp. CEF1]|uniref:sulfotransferase n=1 Tax=Brevundimonas sp. CEF1 TaxID=3442642 RepID=UPI003F51281D